MPFNKRTVNSMSQILHKTKNDCKTFQYKQLSLAFEPLALYQPEKQPGRFALCRKTHPAGKVEQDIFDFQHIETVLSQVAKMPDRHKKHYWISQATLAPWAKNRRISSITQFNAVWVDIDIEHPPADFDKSRLPYKSTDKYNYVELAKLLALQMADAGLPPPSYIVATGGGLCIKYLFRDSLTSEARARWQSVQAYLIKRIAALGDVTEGQKRGWPVDTKASDAARILRLPNTINPRWGEMCQIVFDTDTRYDFDYLADAILPYSREQTKAFLATMKERAQFDANREAANKLSINRISNASIDALMSDEAARSLWCSRFEFARAVFQFRGGVTEGNRNNHFWPVANAIAYSCTGADALTTELAALHHAFFNYDGWKQAEAMQTAASVKQRLQKAGTGGLYKMRTSTFLESLDVTDAEKKAFSNLLGISKHNQNRHNWQEGVMGFQKMQGLELEDYIRETRRRQAEAGKRSAEIRSTTKSMDLRQKVILMANSGCTQKQIANETGVSQQSISRWLAKK